MPITTIKFEVKNDSTDDNATITNPSEFLRSQGPRLPAKLTVSDAQQVAMIERGIEVPSESGFVMFDTGASISSFDMQAAQRTGLAVIGKGNMDSASHDKQPAPIYTGKLTLFNNVSFTIEKGIGANLDSHKLIALIGRDILSLGTLFYHGVEGIVCFSI